MIIDTQKTFNSWTIVGPLFKQSRAIDGAVEAWVPCLCACGTYRAVKMVMLKNGHSKSCGACKGVTADSKKLYNVYRGMLARCYGNAHKNYSSYGGRGIYVCDEWKAAFIEFKKWALSSGYIFGLQLDRINNNGNYAPENCRWVTQSRNNKNKRDNHIVTAFGETKCLADWVLDPRCAVAYSTLRARIMKNIPPEVAVATKDIRQTSFSVGLKIAAFGKTKSIDAWAKDPICAFTAKHLRRRLSNGASPEYALTVRKRAPRKKEQVTFDGT